MVRELISGFGGIILTLAAAVGMYQVPPVISNEFVGEGTLVVYHVDDFTQQQAQNSTWLRQGNTTIKLSSTKPLNLISGARVQVKGRRVADTVVVSPEDVQVLSGGIPQAVTGPTRLLVVPVEFPNSPTRPFTREQITERVFSGPFQRFYQEQSYGRLSLTGEVTEWVRVTRSLPGAACNSVEVGTTEIAAYLTNHQINLADYYGVVFLININSLDSSGSCAIVGQTMVSGQALSLAWVAFPSSVSAAFNFPFAWERLDQALAHEVGHNLGLYSAGAGHADALDCGSAALGANCQHVEYGNHYDVMGMGTLATHFNAFYKETLGWIRPAEALTISQSGDYTIGALEHPVNYSGAGPYRLAKIQAGSTAAFYLEYRQAIGFDANLRDSDLTNNQNGLMINRVLPHSTPELLSMRPNSSSWVGNVRSVSLNGTSTFSDPLSGVTVGPIISRTDSAITFRVTMPSEAGYRWQDLF